MQDTKFLNIDHNNLNEAEFKEEMNFSINQPSHLIINTLTPTSTSSSSISSTSSTTIFPEADAPSLIPFLNNLLIDAVKKGISDLHFEPYENYLRLRVRQDGILYETLKISLNLAPRLISRLKIMSDLDISERRLPQDGRFKLSQSGDKITNKEQLTLAKEAIKNIESETKNMPHINMNLPDIDFRISSCPTLFGEKIVVRILDTKQMNFDINKLGLEPFQKELLLAHIYKPQGLILVTGPTGSGKTLTLYSVLKLLNTESRNILSCEDPVEIYLPGINQVNINSKAGLNFATSLRAFLRQDPDIIMLGEIRDLETAEIAIKASQTGHLLLSTLHTNSAIESINRLRNMGIPNYNLASSLSLVIAQRLARRLCDQCKIPRNFPTAILLQLGFMAEEIDQITFFAAQGCEHCNKGYKGRIGIYELLPINAELQMGMLNAAHSIALQRQAEQQGIWSLKRAALNKVKEGITSIEEVQRVILD